MSSNKESNDKPPAIAYNVENNGSTPLSPVPSQPRPPRNLQDLLRYSSEASNSLGENATGGNFTPLDEESKSFLDGVLKSMTVDVVEELMKSITSLQKVSNVSEEEDPAEYEEALDYIFDYVDNLDVANDFHKIGGFCVFKPCLESPHGSLRWRGAELIAELCQNNPYCQKRVLDMGLMPHLLDMIERDGNETVRVKALYAVSCLVRDSEEGLQEFINCDGFSALLRVLQTDVEKLIIKATFLLSCICHWKPEIKDDLVDMGYVEQLISQLSIYVNNLEQDHPASQEHLLRAILDLIKDHEGAQEIARKPQLQFKILLDHILQNSEDSDQYREENELAKSLISLVFEETEGSEEER